MNESLKSIISVLLTLFVLIISTLVILGVFEVINKDQLTDSAGKIGLSLLVLAIASVIIRLVNKDKQ